MKRLSGDTGTIIGPEREVEGDTDEKMVRPAILVHAGTFQSQDGEISFDEKRIKRIVDNHNAMIQKLAAQYGGLDKMPVGAYPPILDQHADDSNHRVLGRLASLLRFEKRDIPKVGTDVPCATADIHFLGKDTVQKVKDGRIYHLSIGIDEGTDTLGETSTVIEPAAPGAMLLRKQKIETKQKPKGGTKMSVNNKTAERRAKLSAIQDSLKGIKRTIATSSNNVRMEAAKAKVTSQFKRLMASGKMTPAEFKKMDIKKLAALDEASIATVMGAFSVREPVITPGQRGSTDGVEFSELGAKLEQRQRKNLKSEVVRDIVKMSGKKLNLSKGDEDEDEKKLAEEKATVKKEMAAEMPEDKKLAEGDMIPNADTAAEETAPAATAQMQEQIDELNTQVARIAGMVEELMKDEDEEESDSEDKEPSNVEAASEAVAS